jgi:hypothetical protein
MEIYNKFKESESIVIEGDKKIGKMSLAIFLSYQFQNQFTFLSPLSTNKIDRKIESFQKNFDNFKNLKVNLFSFREDWIVIKNEYGFSYLLKDMEHFISSQRNHIIILHKLDTIFDYSDRDFIDDFFIEILSYGIKYNKKLVFTINVDNVNYDLVGNYLVEASDLYMKMTRPKDKRNIEILFSISPIIDSQYIFETLDRKLILQTKDISGYSKREIDVVVISKNRKLQNFHHYILDKKDINLKIIDSISDSLSIVSNIPDFLIFTQEFDDVNFNICEISKQNNFKTLYLVNRDFVRVDDRLTGREKGCVDVIGNSMQMMHYILELEKFFGVIFYKSKLINIEINLKTKEELKKHINYLLKERVLFTIIKIEGKIDKDNLKFLRKYDDYIEFENYSIIILLNLLKGEVSKILFKKIEEMFVMLKLQDCLDIFYGDKLCID